MRLSRWVIFLVLICAACNLNTTEVADLPTPSPVAATAQSTRTPIPFGTQQIQLTPVGSAATLAPPPLPLAIPSQIGTVNASVTPDQAVKDYYSAVSQGRYDLGWSMLTDSFKQKFNCCAPNYNYTDYVKWWDSVDTVEIRNVKTVSQTGDHAVVYVEFAYVMNDGRRSALVGDPYIALVFDSTLNAWRFDDKRATA
jgi:hypothetical protein